VATPGDVHLFGPAALPDEAFAVALASTPGIGPATLRRLRSMGSWRLAWEELRQGRVEGGRDLGALLRDLDVAALWHRHVGDGIGVVAMGTPGYPEALARVKDAPALLFLRGAQGVPEARLRVAVVGTRSATPYGLGVAGELGRDLAVEGVTVVSGLALGIDGAAHEGVMASMLDGSSEGPVPAPPLGVVAGGLDRPYPPSRAELWRKVRGAGVLLSEVPAGTRPERWRFPRRSRLMAALCDMVVVVESHRDGGSWHTVRAARACGVPVGAVPGSVRSPASVGTNQLLAEGCVPVRGAHDVLGSLGCRTTHPWPPPPPHPATSGSNGRGGRMPGVADVTPELLPAARHVLAALGFEAVPMEVLLARTGLPLSEVSDVLERLGGAGWVAESGGWWTRS
jgi:DNA processing protein